MKRIWLYSGALVAFHIGSGFASGQEILQFFTAYGFWQGILAMVLSCFLLIGCTVWIFLSELHNRQNRNQTDWRAWCAPGVASLFQKLIPFFLFLQYTVMLSGSGAVLTEYFGCSAAVGRLLMMILSVLTVASGMNHMVQIVGKLGPVILTVLTAAALYGMATSPVPALSQAVQLPASAPNCFFSACYYAGMPIMTGMLFLEGIAREMQNKKQAVLTAILGNLLFMATAVFLHGAFWRHLPEMVGQQIPTLALVKKWGDFACVLFAVLILCGIYTTAVPALWSMTAGLHTSVSQLILLTGISFLCSAFSFQQLLHIVYPAEGICGTFLFCHMLYFQWKQRRKHVILKA